MTYAKHDCHCGPGWMPKFIKRWLSKNFNEACAYHDEGYEKQDSPKELIDDRFLSMMIERSSGICWIVVAYSYFIAVKFFGWISWHRNKIRAHFKRGQ